ncbi:MAG: hypothetical protein F4W93_08210 [Dehalococcoidia bacterium]|nr:hypothetical protein [Dehalococcoidia bacterium]
MRSILALPIALLIVVAACGGSPEAESTPAQTPMPTPVPPTLTPVLPTATPAPPTPTPEDIVSEVIKGWADANADVIVAQITERISLEVPLTGRLADTVLRTQVEDNLALVFSVPRRIGEGLYRLTVTTETVLEFDLPLIGKKAYIVSLPFNVDIDVESRTVEGWEADVSSTKVKETEPSS